MRALAATVWIFMETQQATKIYKIQQSIYLIFKNCDRRHEASARMRK